MKAGVLALAIVFLTAIGSTYGGEPPGIDYSGLKRLRAVLDLPSFPKPTQDGIQAWKQETRSHGLVHKFDFTKFPLDGYGEMPLRDLVKFYGGNAMRNDLGNVVIISDNGRGIRFVNVEDRGVDVAVKRGEVVAFLLSENAK
jgi:hypothetical protein